MLVGLFMDADREMRCCHCSARLFTSRAPALVEAAMPCPQCGGPLELVPLPPSERAVHPRDLVRIGSRAP